MLCSHEGEHSQQIQGKWGKLKRIMTGVCVGIPMLLLTGVFVSSAAAATAPTQQWAPLEFLPGELIANGGAEFASTEGWSGGLATVMPGVGGYPASVIVNENGLTGDTFAGGSYQFVGVGNSSTAWQRVDLNPAAPAIDNGYTRAHIAAFVGGYEAQNDHAQVTFRFLDSTGEVLHEEQFGPVLAADRGYTSGFVPFQSTMLLPPGTRSAEVVIDTLVSIGANDGVVDEISLRLEAPTPVLIPDNATTTAGQSVVIYPLSNDNAGQGAELLFETLRFPHSTAAGRMQVTTAEGEWIIDSAGGSVTFAPSTTFSGSTAPVTYAVTDSSGQTMTGSIAVHVATPIVEDVAPEAEDEPPTVDEAIDPLPEVSVTPGPQVEPRKTEAVTRAFVRQAAAQSEPRPAAQARQAIAEPALDPDLASAEPLSLLTPATPQTDTNRVRLSKSLELEPESSIAGWVTPLGSGAVALGAAIALLATARALRVRALAGRE
ncbi:hypothetical protein GCM10009693_15570 [Leucobacter chromiireducens subsp. chromiireducens]